MPNTRWGDDSRWRDGGGDHWPSQYEGPRRDRWPSFRTEPWRPDHAGPAVIVCERAARGGPTLMLIPFADAAEAEEADRELCYQPCGPGCLGMHFRVWAEPGAVHVERGLHDPPPFPDDLRSALRAAGYRRPPGNNATTAAGADHWPTPSILNLPLQPARRDRGRPNEAPPARAAGPGG